MKLLSEFTIIFLISLLGEIVSSMLPIAIPPAIVALVLLLVLLCLRIVKPQQIELAGEWMLSNMAIFFIPACVSLIEHTHLLMSAWWQILLISIVSFFLTFLTAGYTVVGVQKILERRRKNVSNDNL